MRSYVAVAVVCWWGILSGKGHAQDAEQTIRLSKAIAAHNPDGALRLAERAAFFAGGDTLYRACLWWGDLAMQAKRYDVAEEAYRRASLFGDDRPPAEALYRWAAAHILQQEWHQALWVLENYADTSERTYWILKGTAYWGMEADESAFDAFRRAADSAQWVALQPLMQRPRRWRRPNPMTAYVLSLIIPGLGQAYAGEWGEALNSFLLVGGLAAVGGYVAVAYSVFDAAGIGSWAYRYYMGGAQKAEKLARRRRTLKRKQWYEKVHRVLLATP